MGYYALKVYAYQTKILEDRTNDRACDFEVLLKVVSTLFGLRCFENASKMHARSCDRSSKIFVWEAYNYIFNQFRLKRFGTFRKWRVVSNALDLQMPVLKTANFMLPKRRFCKSEQKIERAISKYFSRV